MPGSVPVVQVFPESGAGHTRQVGPMISDSWMRRMDLFPAR